MLEINISRKIYYNKSGGTEALKQVYLQVKPGEIIGLFGENGAGKTDLNIMMDRFFWMEKKLGKTILPDYLSPPASILFFQILLPKHTKNFIRCILKHSGKKDLKH